MSKFATWAMLICAGFSAACSSTANVSDGTGYRALHPAPATRSFIIANDRAFAQEVASHNAQCAKDKGCTK